MPPPTRCQYFSTDVPGVGHCYWCAEGNECVEPQPTVLDDAELARHDAWVRRSEIRWT